MRLMKISRKSNLMISGLFCYEIYEIDGITSTNVLILNLMHLLFCIFLRTESKC